MTVAALECAALQRCSFLLSIKVRTPCTGHSVRGDFFLLFLLACLCELHRIRIVQAEMGLAGSRTSFSFPPNRKPSFLSAIFCICHHVCPLVHPILPVTAFGWQFLTVAACSWSRFFFWVILQASPPLGDDTLYMASGGLRGTALRIIAFRTKTALKSEKHTMGWYHVNNSGKGINLCYVEDFRYNEEFLAKYAPSKEAVLETVESIRNTETP